MSKTTPKHGASYPLRIGNTLRNGRRRSLVSLKFTHVPNNTQLTQSGCLTRQDDKCTVSLTTSDGQGVLFTGTRTANTAVTDYALVFANGAMWLERADDVFTGMRPTLGEGMHVPNGGVDDVRRDPDSWMVEENGSPITQEGTEGEEVRRPAGGRMVSGGRFGGKSVAGKSVAGKGLSNGNVDTGPPSSSEEEESDNNSDSDDSDDSDSSNEYTDRSSDEEDD